MFAEAHGPEVVLAATASRPTPAAELAAPTATTTGMTLGAAVVAASVVQGLDGEFRKGAGFRGLAFELGERCAYERPSKAAVALAIIVARGWRIAISRDRRERHGRLGGDGSHRRSEDDRRGNRHVLKMR